uniref:SET domain-containing protein n=1 Tax=Aegilops tauschii subsp. strangulata TaxID=200361 RepID=A0A453SHW7_AEGTS
MLPSFYNHDCDPNTHIVWLENADAKLKTLRDIDEGIDRCSSTYLAFVLLTTVKSKKRLMGTKYLNSALLHLS